MTKEEKAIQTIKSLKDDFVDYGLENKKAREAVEALDMAIDAIEALQKFDKIKAEIEALFKWYPFTKDGAYIRKDDVKKIINKYKAESEDKA